MKCDLTSTITGTFRAALVVLATALVLAGCATTPSTGTRETHEEPAAPAGLSKQAASSEAALPEATGLDASIGSLATQIASSFTQPGKIKIAVFNFVDLDGNTNQLGMYLAEELITRLFQSGRFEVVERRLLDKVLEEQKLTMSGLVESASVQKLGSILGVKAIVTGTVTDLESAVKINARIIAADTGSLSAAAGVSMQKDTDVKRLMVGFSQKPSPAFSSGSKPQGRVSATSVVATAPAPPPPPKTFFFEDFSGVTKGLIPSGWIGGETFLVNESSTLRGKKVLTTVSKGPHSFIIRDIPFPNDWVWEVHLINHQDCCDPVVFQFGDLSAGFHTNGDSWLQKTFFRYDDDSLENKTAIHTIEKRGDVFRSLINGREYAVVRVPGFKSPTTFRFDYDMDRQESVTILRIEGRSL